MRRSCFLLLVVLVLGGVGGSFTLAGADRGGYHIERFHTELTINTNSTLLVEERIEVFFSESRHGIYRDIPVRYTDPKGYAFSLGFRLVEVVDEQGRSHGTKVSGHGRYIKIRIGDAKRTVRDRVVYIIRYRIENALGHFAEHDELYWNATGTDWNVPILEASATVHLPAPLTADSLQTAAYVGRFGSRSREAQISVLGPGVVRFQTRQTLAPLEGLTVAVAWPPDHVTFPGAATRTAQFFTDNWILLAPFLFLVFLIRAYRRSGRDPDARGSVMVRYEPPEGITAGELGTLVDETVDLRDITASLVGLAVRGHLIIRVEEKKLLFGLLKGEETFFEKKRDPSPDPLLPHEKLIMKGVFESGDVVSSSDLKEEFYQHIPSIKDALYENLTKSGFFAGKPSSVRTRYQVAGILLGILTAGVGVGWAAMRGGVFPMGLLAPLVAGFLTLGLFIFFAPAMPKRTRSGVRMRNWALGFQEFVDRVEREHLEANEARNIFESLLPYAMALGIASKWARKFEGIYQKESPAWYVGHGFHGFSTKNFEQSLSSSMSDVGKNMAASPRSSGSGGGGFSGGGGGGGGGGSW